MKKQARGKSTPGSAAPCSALQCAVWLRARRAALVGGARALAQRVGGVVDARHYREMLRLSHGAAKGLRHLHAAPLWRRCAAQHAPPPAIRWAAPSAAAAVQHGPGRPRHQLLSTSAAGGSDAAGESTGAEGVAAVGAETPVAEVAASEASEEPEPELAGGADGDGDGGGGAAAQPKTFDGLMATVDQLREAGTPLEDTASAMLLVAITEGGFRVPLKKENVEKVKQVLTLIEEEELKMSNRQLQKLLGKLRHRRKGATNAGADLACSLTDAFFASGTAVDVDSYNLLLQVVLKHNVQKCVKVAGTMSEFPGVYANQQTFSIVIEACTRTKRLEEAIGFVNQMRKMRYSPRPVLLAKLLELCALENNAEAARVCLDVLDQQAQRRGLTFDDGTVILLANLAARAGSFDLLTDLNHHLERSPSGSPPAIGQSGAFLNASLHCAASAVQLDSCFALVESMVGAGVEPDHATMMSAARSIAVDEETIDDAYYAVEARHTDGEPISVESLNLVILACANLGCVP